MTGLRPWVYWLSAYIWDFFFYLLPCTLILLIITVIIKVDVYTGRALSVWILVLVLLLFGFAEIPMVYTLQFIFTSAPKGYTLITMFNIISGFIGAITVPIVSQLNSPNVAHTWEIILSAFFPTYNLSNCFYKVYNNEYARNACKKVNCEIFKLNPISGKACCGSESGEFLQTFFWISKSFRAFFHRKYVGYGKRQRNLDRRYFLHYPRICVLDFDNCNWKWSVWSFVCTFAWSRQSFELFESERCESFGCKFHKLNYF